MQEQLHTFLTLAADSEDWNPIHSSLGQLSNGVNRVVKTKILAPDRNETPQSSNPQAVTTTL
jgi:hypothetical protein